MMAIMIMIIVIRIRIIPIIMKFINKINNNDHRAGHTSSFSPFQVALLL